MEGDGLLVLGRRVQPLHLPPQGGAVPHEVGGDVWTHPSPARVSNNGLLRFPAVAHNLTVVVDTCQLKLTNNQTGYTFQQSTLDIVLVCFIFLPSRSPREAMVSTTLHLGRQAGTGNNLQNR